MIRAQTPLSGLTATEHQGLALHPKSRAVWATEHGARGGDELNLIRRGQNYGWPKATYSVEYFGLRISERTTLAGAVDPRVVWTPCIAPSGLAFYTGPEFPQWQGTCWPADWC